MPECVAPSFPINYILGFCMSHWKYSLRGLLAKFPLSFCCYLLLWYPHFCNFAVDKMSLSFFLLYSKKKRQKERRAEMKKASLRAAAARAEVSPWHLQGSTSQPNSVLHVSLQSINNHNYGLTRSARPDLSSSTHELLHHLLVIRLAVLGQNSHSSVCKCCSLSKQWLHQSSVLSAKHVVIELTRAIYTRKFTPVGLCPPPQPTKWEGRKEEKKTAATIYGGKLILLTMIPECKITQYNTI